MCRLRRVILIFSVVCFGFSDQAFSQTQVYPTDYPDCLTNPSWYVSIKVDSEDIPVCCLEPEYDFPVLPHTPPAPAVGPGPAHYLGADAVNDTHGCGEDCPVANVLYTTSRGNPINAVTLNKHQVEVDYVGPGALPLRIIRHYNSTSAGHADNKGAFGQGWTANFGESLVAIKYGDPQNSQSDYEVVIRNETGYRFKITSPTGVSWTTEDGRPITFNWNPSFEIFTWVDNGLTKIFLKSGDLTMMSHPNGEMLSFAYDPNASPSELTSITHSTGASLTFNYDSSARVSTITDPGGRVYSYVYGANGNLDYTLVPDTGSTTAKIDYLYEDSNFVNGLTGKIWYFNGYSRRTSTYSYDSNQMAKSTSLGFGGVNSYDFQTTSNPNFSQTTVTNVHGKTFNYQFDTVAGEDRILNIVENAHGTTVAATQSFTYDSTGRFDKITDAEGNVIDYDFNNRGQLDAVTSGFGETESRTTSHEWTDPNSIPSPLAPDKRNILWDQPRKIVTPLLETEVLLTVSGLPDSISVKNKSTTYGIFDQERKWNFTYTLHSPDAIEISEIEVNGPRTDVDDITTYAFDTSTRLTSITQQVSPTLDLVTTLSNYDAHGRVQKITYPTGLVRDITYHPRGFVTQVKVTLDLGGPNQSIRTTDYKYFGNGDLEQITYPDGSEEIFAYDGNGRLNKITLDDGDSDPYDIEGQWIFYDVGNNIYKIEAFEFVSSWIEDPNCNPPWWEPEPCEQIQIWTEQTSFDRDFEYDSLDRLKKIKYTGGIKEIEYSYNKIGQLKEILDGFDLSTSATFDANNYPHQTTYRDGGISEVSYDANGNLSGVKDALGVWTYYRRDGFGQAWEIDSPATGLTTYEYDAAGNLTKKVDGRGTVITSEYDALNRLLGRSNGNIQTEYTYDTDRLGYLHVLDESSGDHTYTRNDAGELLSKTMSIAGQTLTMSYSYDSFGRLDEITYPSGLTVNYAYDSFGRVNQVTAAGAGVSSTTVVSGVNYYPFGPTKRITYGNGELRTYVYDTDYQLTQLVSGLNINNSYIYDNNWNISSFDGRSITYDKMDRVETHTGPDGNWEYSYDPNGNRIWHKDNGFQTNYNYDSSNTKLLSLSGGTTETREYHGNGDTYKIDGRKFYTSTWGRFWKYKEGSDEYKYYHSAFGERMLKRNSQTTYKTWFMYNGPNLMHEQTSNDERDYIYAAGELVGFAQDGEIFYVHTDHLGRPEIVTNASKSVRWTSENNAFGNNPGSDLIGGLNIGFPGQYYDIENGMYYNYFRTYDSLTGRYLQSDPIGLAGGLNTYGYAASNPLSFADPYGLTTVAVPVIIEGVVLCGPAAPACAAGAAVVVAYGVGQYCAVPIGDALDRVFGAYSEEAPDLPDVEVGQPDDKSRPKRKRKTVDNGPLAPEHGGTGDAETDFGVLGGPDSTPTPNGGKIAPNGVRYRPGTDLQGPRIDIPANGTKSPETLHYPKGS